MSLPATKVIKYPRTPHLFDAGGTCTTEDDLILSTKDMQHQDRFFSRSRFHRTMRNSGIPVVPIISVQTFGPYNKRSGHTTSSSSSSSKMGDTMKADLLELLQTESVFRNDGGNLEGVVLRIDDEENTTTTTNNNVPVGWLVNKWKIVRPDFVRGCNEGHWMRRKIEKQIVDYNFAEEYLSSCYVFADKFIEQQFQSNAEQADEARNVESSGGSEEAKDQRQSTTSSKWKAKAAARQRREYEAQRTRTRRNVPRCVVLTGLPGSGKLTFASRLAEGHSEKGLQRMIANQEKMRKKECIALAGQARRGNRIIIDRCNPTEKERLDWLKVMHEPSKQETALVYFSADAEECIERVQRRTHHETIPEGRGETAVRTVAEQLEAPTENDYNMFGIVQIVSSFEESNELLQRWGVDGLSTTN